MDSSSDSDGGNSDADGDFQVSDSESDVDDEDSFIAHDDDNDEDYAKPKKSKTSTIISKKPPLPKSSVPKKPAAAASKYTMVAEQTPTKTKTPSTPMNGGSSPFFSTPGYVSSVQSTPTSTPATPNMVTSTGESITLPEGVVGRGSHEHNSFAFLFPAQRKDMDGRKMDDPSYNPRTLFVPPKFLSDQTPAMAQWWYFKQRNMDTILFFKVGKFYELFHMDADVGYGELDLIYMKGAKAHSGFPEISYGKYANILVSKGYRVARIEQTETPDMLKERNDAAVKGKKDKVVAREICALMSAGTRTYCHLDDTSLLDSNSPAQSLSSMPNSMLLAVHEKEVVLEDGEVVKEFGLCCVDSILHNIVLAQFEDDVQRTRLRTFLATYPPHELVMIKDSLSTETQEIVKMFSTNNVVVESIHTSEMLSTKEVVKMLTSYFECETNLNTMPVLLQKVLEGLDDGSSELLVASLGNVLWQLKRSLLDYEMFSMGKVYAYVPLDEDSQPIKSMNAVLSAVEEQPEIADFPTNALGGNVGVSSGDKKYMVLDEISITNLELLVNSYNHTYTGSLYQFLNHTKTPFGSRLLKQWLLHPLFTVADIEDRKAAVEELTHWEEIDSIRSQLAKVPDLERLLTRIYSNSLYVRNNHPANKAVMYEDHIYRSRQIKDFTDILQGNDIVLQVVEKVLKMHSDSQSNLLKTILPLTDASRFPLKKMKELIHYFHSIFDINQVKKDGYILPLPGINPEYDQAMQEIQEITQKLHDYLQEMKKETGIREISFFHSNKDRYQLEIPMAATGKVPSNWTSKSQKKTHRRYVTPTTDKLLAKLVEIEERKQKSMKLTLYTLFQKFYSFEAVWKSIMECVGIIDVLLSFAKISSLPGYTWPQLVSKEDTHGTPVLKVVQGRHPMLEQVLAQR
ncbi:MutS family DNA mismatch repair protein [archaeon]|nr:MAG: MutS family DNA mismatch repair protein [archaeon]